MTKAKQKIVISLPSGTLIDKYENDIYNCLTEAKKKGITVLIKCNKYSELPDKWKEYTWGTQDATFPIIMIDDHITWYGAPFAKWKFEDNNKGYQTVYHYACRIRGERTAEIIKTMAELEYRKNEHGASPLLPRPETHSIDTNGESVVGLAAFVLENVKCEKCKSPIPMTKGKSGKTILWCKTCKHTQLLTPDIVNRYINKHNVKCPKCKSGLTAKVSKYGLYIRCDSGDIIKPEEI